MLLRALPLLFLALPLLAADPPARKPVVVTDAALKLQAESLVIDGHNDLPWELRRKDDMGSFRTIDIARPQPRLHTDLPRLKKGGVGAQFWSVYVPANTAGKGTAVKTTLEQIDIAYRMIQRYPNDLELALGTADIERIRKTGKIASLMGMEGGHSIDNSLEILRTMYRLGVRYMTLTHNEDTPWADSATGERAHGGLTDRGREVVAEDRCLAAVRPEQRGEHAQQRRLARAVGAEDDQRRAGLHGQRDVGERRAVAVAARQSVQLNGWGGWHLRAGAYGLRAPGRVRPRGTARRRPSGCRGS